MARRLKGQTQFQSLTQPQQQLSFNSEHRLRAENLSWDLDVWYPLVKEFTFRTNFIPLVLEEAKAIRGFHDVSWRHLRKHLTQREIDVLQRLEEDIDSKIRSEFPNGAFVRLCGRSPKDGEPLEKERVLKQYEENLVLVQKTFGFDKTTSKMMAIARTNYLKVFSGAEVMSLLLTSERVYADMIDWIKYGEPEQICLRDWSPDMSMDYEFRVFVCSDEISAISQYDHYCHYPHLETQRNYLKAGIESLWKKIHFRVGVSSYIFDVAYLPTSESFIVIEFSPFFPCTGPALFNWTLDKDTLEGRLPFEFRLKSKRFVFPPSSLVTLTLLHSDLHPQIDELLESNWDDRWREIANTPLYSSYYEVSAEEAELLARSALTPRRRQLLLRIGIAYLCACVVGILTTLIYFVKLSSHIHTTSQHASPSFPVRSSLVSSLALLMPLYQLIGGLFSTPARKQNSLATPSGSFPSLSSSTLLFVYGTLKTDFQWNQKYLHNRGGCGAVLVGGATTRDKHRLVVGDSGVPYLCLNSSLSEESEECVCNATSPIENGTDNCFCRCASCQHNIHRPNRSWTGDTAATSLAAISLGASSASLWTKPSTSPPSSSPGALADGERVHGELWAVTPECLQNLDDYEGLSKGYYLRKRISVQLHDSSNSLVLASVYCLESLPPHLENGPFLEEYSLAYHREFYRPVAHIQVKQLNYIQTISTWGNVQDEKLSRKGMENVKN
jgi:gamma-glutamylcyclotransferase (GGCT)/AIG2-like uncharacterized protein YtfP